MNENPITDDETGKTLFAASFDHRGQEYALAVWAYDADDAEEVVKSARSTLRIDGEVFHAGEYAGGGLQ